MAIIAPQPHVKSKGRLLTIADVAVLPSDLPSDPKKKYELDNGRLVSEPFTIADVAVMPRELPTGPIDYELDDGVLVLMSPTGRRHGVLQGRISAHLIAHGDDHGLGETVVKTGVILWKNPDRLVGPDVAFLSKASFPIRESPEGYIEALPDLVVEVRSKNDTLPEVQQKVSDYLKAGVKTVLVVDSDAKTVTLHRQTTPAATYSEQDVLDLDDVIPGCSIRLADLFRP